MYSFPRAWVATMRLGSFIFLLALSPAHAQGLKIDPWTREDTYRQAALTALLVVDWRQTRYTAKHPEQFRETGVTGYFTGEHPSVGVVNNYFLTSIIASAAISYVLPAHWRPWWQYGYIAYEANYVHQNYLLGIKILL